MAESYSFFDAEMTDSGTYDRTYNSADLASYFSSFIGNGVFVNPATSLQVVANGTSLAVKQGSGYINGYFYNLAEDPLAIPMAIGDGIYPRIDLVCLSLNLSERLIEVKVVKGDPAASPKEPAFSRTNEIYDLVLAKVNVAAGQTSWTDADITDLRFNDSYCGIVEGVVSQISTTGLFKQYDSEFNTWFDNAKDQLTSDAAGNLLNLVNTAQSGVDQNKEDIAAANKTIAAQPVIRSGTSAPSDSLGVDGDIYIHILS
jgi:hypothetical protein